MRRRRYRLPAWASTASAAESLRSRWGSLRWAPVFSSHGSSIAAPQVGQGTENICFKVSSLAFTTSSCNGRQWENAHYCSFSTLYTEYRAIAQIAPPREFLKALCKSEHSGDRQPDIMIHGCGCSSTLGEANWRQQP